MSTWHDEDKYQSLADQLSQAIQNIISSKLFYKPYSNPKILIN